jgi:hypothetical protein
MLVPGVCVCFLASKGLISCKLLNYRSTLFRDKTLSMVNDIEHPSLYVGES